MKGSRIATLTIGASAIGFGVWWYLNRDTVQTAPYRTASVERGDLEAAVASTGTLSAVTTVQVGTQVSGQVAEILVDFNDHVKKGQLVARIDSTLQEQAVREAQTGVDRASAELARAQRDYDRNAKMLEDKIITPIEFQDTEYRLRVAKASMQSAEISFDRAKRNLAYTSIYAPIDGIVVERNVNVGQTVAASLSAPQIFLIANDLRQMQILASVDESDIGMIREGQQVRFSVQTYPNESFHGAVRQVRLQSTTQENVVNYTVVVGVDNPESKLLPGMTATVDFLTGSATDVLMVPNAALRFRATPEMVAAAFRDDEATDRSESAAGAATGGSASAAATRRGGGTSRSGGGGARTGNGGGRSTGAAARGGTGAGRAGGGPPAAGESVTLWYLRDDGLPASTVVRTGLSDGQRTVIEGGDVSQGTKVIIGLAQTTPAPAAGSTNPLQPQGRGRGRGFGGF